jgi:hypothetical protein
MLNSKYLAPAMKKKMLSAFKSNSKVPSISLQDIFVEQYHSALLKEVSTLPFKKKIDKMRYSYFSSEPSKTLHSLLNSSEVLSLVSTFCKKKAKKIEGRFYLFSWKDYTLLHDKAVLKPGIDIVLDLTPSWDPSFGGSAVYADGAGEFHSLLIAPNTLTIVERKKGVQHFVQYVNHHAKKRQRILFLGTIS